MSDLIINQCPAQYKRLFVFVMLFGLFMLTAQNFYAHQQPTTIVLLDVAPEKVTMKLEIPLTELELAFGHDAGKNPETLIGKFAPELKDYLKTHIQPTTDGQPWTTAITALKIEKAEQTQSGAYQEITVNLELKPPANIGTRKFTLNYDVIMHQVVSHKALVSIRNDWETGSIGENTNEASVIAVDTRTTQIFPLEINLEKGSWWKGFKGMVSVGMQHIKEGIDHLLFLLVLLLPAALLVNGKKWGEFGGSGYSVKRLLKIVTAFTVGHSITLLVGALNLFRLPPQPVEVLIAVSISISAVHAIRPIFPGKETYVAAGFGLVHGLAFATVLADLNLSAGPMALSILGFNIGIELMQIFVIAVTVPWLILLSLTSFYKWFRIGGAILAGAASLAWIAERISGDPNAISRLLENFSEYAHFGILLLAVIALSAFGLQFGKLNKSVVKTQ